MEGKELETSKYKAFRSFHIKMKRKIGNRREAEGGHESFFCLFVFFQMWDIMAYIRADGNNPLEFQLW